MKNPYKILQLYQKIIKIHYVLLFIIFLQETLNYVLIVKKTKFQKNLDVFKTPFGRCNILAGKVAVVRKLKAPYWKWPGMRIRKYDVWIPVNIRLIDLLTRRRRQENRYLILLKCCVVSNLCVNMVVLLMTYSPEASSFLLTVRL